MFDPRCFFMKIEVTNILTNDAKPELHLSSSDPFKSSRMGTMEGTNIIGHPWPQNFTWRLNALNANGYSTHLSYQMIRLDKTCENQLTTCFWLIATDFPSIFSDQLLPQAHITPKLLHKSRIMPWLFAYALGNTQRVILCSYLS